MKVLILGKGFIESQLPSHWTRYTGRVYPSYLQMEQILDAHKPDVIVNCVAKTGRPNVDECETAKGETIIANITIPTMLADLCEKRGVQLLHFGSGCIFFEYSKNKNGWNENDVANPESFYSITKYSTDLALSKLDNVCILRIRMPVTNRPMSRDYLSKIVKYDKIIDAPNSFSFMEDVIGATVWAIDNKKSGIYHVTNPGILSPVDFAQEYKKHFSNFNFKKINSKELMSFVKAPRSNCVLDSSKIAREGFVMSSSHDLLSRYVARYAEKVREGLAFPPR